jgi:hypothetical protein
MSNPNITKVSIPTRWKPGQSGNPAGRPVGIRTVFSEAFVRDLCSVWSEHGKETMIKTAQKQPQVFFATCARLIPQQVAVDLQATLPGSLSPERLGGFAGIIGCCPESAARRGSARAW